MRAEAGGALAALRHRGIDVLRPMPPDSASPLDAACFPLVPYCNRIRDGRFRFGGREVVLPPNFAPEPHSLHGLSWQAPLVVLSSPAPPEFPQRVPFRRAPAGRNQRPAPRSWTTESSWWREPERS